MKKLVIIIVSLAALIACNPKMEKENVALKAEIDSLKMANERLKEGSGELTVTIDNYKELLDEIDQNLATIDETSAMVRKLDSESGKKDEEAAESIKNHLKNIDVLMENSRLKIIALDRNLNKLRKDAGDQSNEILALEERVNQLASDVLMKDQEMIIIEDELYDEIKDLENKLKAESAKSAELAAILNRAFYIKGTSKQLQDMGIIKKEGGFIGLGKVKMLNATASTALFTQIEKDKIDSIDLSCKKAMLITAHPDDSYKLLNGKKDMIESLAINDSDAFWKKSNYLVLEVVN